MSDRHECQICARQIKTSRGGLLVNHGYQRPGWGYLLGGCFGVGHRPFPETDAIMKAVEYAEREAARMEELSQTTESFLYSIAHRYVGRKRVPTTRTISSLEELTALNEDPEVDRRERPDRRAPMLSCGYGPEGLQKLFNYLLERRRADLAKMAKMARRDAESWRARKELGDRIRAAA